MRAIWLFWLLCIVAAIAAPIVFAQEVKIVCDQELCAMTRCAFEAIVQELTRLRALIGKSCT